MKLKHFTLQWTKYAHTAKCCKAKFAIVFHFVIDINQIQDKTWQKGNFIVHWAFRTCIIIAKRIAKIQLKAGVILIFSTT